MVILPWAVGDGEHSGRVHHGSGFDRLLLPREGEIHRTTPKFSPRPLQPASTDRTMKESRARRPKRRAKHHSTQIAPLYTDVPAGWLLEARTSRRVFAAGATTQDTEIRQQQQIHQISAYSSPWSGQVATKNGRSPLTESKQRHSTLFDREESSSALTSPMCQEADQDDRNPLWP